MNTNEGLKRPGLAALTLAALGVVYGDLGTSPLYAIRECFLGSGLQPAPENVLGILSLVFWAVMLVISFKYLVIILRADNRGEGGILALLALNKLGGLGSSRNQGILIAAGIVGTGLMYGDGMITPAISVLSAVEGLTVTTRAFEPFIIPIALGILTGLFLLQRRGTGRVGAMFGPVLVLWFVVIGLLGILSIIKAPEILRALDPRHGLRFLALNGVGNFAVLGSVFLALTGAEALYADIGHFGKKPVRIGWFSLVLPGLLLNYFGQGAHLLQHPGEVEHLFYRLAPEGFLYPLVALATAATVIASQAVITGCFSITRQAVQLGFWPRLTVVHTSSYLVGQVYMPVVNGLLFVGTCVLILQFRASGMLASAYGMAVSGIMLITTVLTAVVARRLWRIPLWVLLPILAGFLAVDVAFLAANSVKILQGGWVPLLVAGISIALMRIWRAGRERLRVDSESQALETNLFLADIRQSHPLRVPGTAVFLTSGPTGIPRSLLHNYKHNRVIHERTILLSVQNEEIPFVPAAERAAIQALGEGLYRVSVRCGFSESPNIPAALSRLSSPELPLEPNSITFFLGRQTLLIRKDRGLQGLQSRIFSFMSRNSRDPTHFFSLPPNRVVELGVQIAL